MVGCDAVALRRGGAAPMMRLESAPAADDGPARPRRDSARPAWLVRAIFAAALMVQSAAVRAQGVTTAGIQGSVRDVLGQDVDAAVHVRDIATGFSVDVRTSRGRFLVPGLESGGPYAVTVRALGFAPQ